MNQGPLTGIRVLELAHYHMGPGAGMFLSDMGAEVVHIEERGRGDLMRQFASFWGVDFTLGDRNTFTEDLLRGKRSLAIDLTKDQGKQVLHELVAEADVFLTNMRPAALQKLGATYEDLRAVNSGLVYCQGSGYGAHGAFKDSPGNEMMGLARSGLMLGSASRGEEPIYPTVGVNDRLGSIGMAMGILAALVAKERTGVGQQIHTSLLGWMVNLQAVGATVAANTGQDPRPPRRSEANDPLYNYYQCRDGVWVALGMVIHKEKFWPLVCQALGAPDLVTDERFATAQDREVNSAELITILDGLFAKIDYADWEVLAQQNDFIASRINALPDLATDPQVLANDYIAEYSHPELDSFKYVTTPLEFSETPVTVQGPAPQLGEHNREVLADWLSMDGESIEQLERSEVI